MGKLQDLLTNFVEIGRLRQENDALREEKEALQLKLDAEMTRNRDREDSLLLILVGTYTKTRERVPPHSEIGKGDQLPDEEEELIERDLSKLPDGVTKEMFEMRFNEYVQQAKDNGVEYDPEVLRTHLIVHADKYFSH